MQLAAHLIVKFHADTCMVHAKCTTMSAAYATLHCTSMSAAYAILLQAYKLLDESQSLMDNKVMINVIHKLSRRTHQLS